MAKWNSHKHWKHPCGINLQWKKREFTQMIGIFGHDFESRSMCCEKSGFRKRERVLRRVNSIKIYVNFRRRIFEEDDNEKEFSRACDQIASQFAAQKVKWLSSTLGLASVVIHRWFTVCKKIKFCDKIEEEKNSVERQQEGSLGG